MERDEADARNIRTCIDTWLPYLWKHGHAITNLASGEIATDEMTNDIIALKNRGEVARHEFIKRFTKNQLKIEILQSDQTKSVEIVRKRNTQYQKMKANLSLKSLQLLIKRSNGLLRD